MFIRYYFNPLTFDHETDFSILTKDQIAYGQIRHKNSVKIANGCQRVYGVSILRIKLSVMEQYMAERLITYYK